MGKGGKNKDAKTRGTKSCLFYSVVLDTPYMKCYSRWNHKCQPRPQGLSVYQIGGGRREEGLPQPRTQASSRYPSYKRRLGTESEFSRQAWQVMSDPKSPRTTGNEAGSPLQPPYSGTQDNPGDQETITIFVIILPHLQRLAGLLNQTNTHFTVAWLVIEIVDNKNKGVIPHLCCNYFWNSSVDDKEEKTLIRLGLS